MFIYSHITKTTTWEDPRKSLAAQAVANSVQHQSAEALLTQTPVPQPINTPTTPGMLFVTLIFYYNCGIGRYLYTTDKLFSVL